MSFSTETNKLQKLWNQVEDNKDAIITQKDNNTFIIDNIDILNRKNSVFPILTNFSSDWFVDTLEGVDGNNDPIVDASVGEFRLIFNNVDPLFIPYIHCEVIYRIGTSGVIPLVDNPAPSDPDEIPFDEDLAGAFGGDRLEVNEIFQINETNVEYIALR